MRGFKAFLLRGNVVDLAVGVVIGVAFTAVVTGFTGSFITPLIAAIFGSGRGLGGLTFTVKQADDRRVLKVEIARKPENKPEGPPLIAHDELQKRLSEPNLRLLDVPVPSIYGPSADENPFAAHA